MREPVQEKLPKSEQRYRSLIEATSQIIWNTKAEGEFVSEQPGWSAFTGQNFDELKGWGWLNAVHPEDRANTVQVWKAASANRGLYQVEHRLRRYDGEYRYMSVRGVPVFEDDGRIDEWIGAHMDITESKRVQEALARALAEAQTARTDLQRVFMQAPALIQVCRGPDHVIEAANSLYIQVAGKRDLIGKQIREAFPELAGQGFFELLDRVYETGEPFVGREMPVLFDRTSNGIIEESFWNFVYQPLVDAEGKVYGIITHAVEVTAQVRARQEVEKKAEELAQLTQALERTNRELDNFAYIASHDLKAPLRGIANLSEWVEEDLANNITEETRQHLNLMRGRVHRMEGLIDGILQYSRAGRTQHQVEKVDVAELMQEVIELLAPPPTASIAIASGMPILETERVPLQQIFMNLINNAIKYAQRDDVHIRIGVREVEKYYEFSVSDNGPGIAPEYHDKIWGIFQRLESRDKIEGTGIGLSVVKKIVESRGGWVWVESIEGTGATFRFMWSKNLVSNY